MSKEFPHHNFLAEPLHSALSVSLNAGEGRKQPTPIILSKSLFVYVLKTFTATSRPPCSPFHTSVNPPLYNASWVRS